MYPLKPIHDWVKNYGQSWSQRFDLLDVVLEELKETERWPTPSEPSVKCRLPQEPDPAQVVRGRQRDAGGDGDGGLAVALPGEVGLVELRGLAQRGNDHRAISRCEIPATTLCRSR